MIYDDEENIGDGGYMMICDADKWGVTRKARELIKDEIIEFEFSETLPSGLLGYRITCDDNDNVIWTSGFIGSFACDFVFYGFILSHRDKSM